MAQSANKKLGTHMEERREEARNGEHEPENEWYDVRDGDTPVEVKTTAKNVENPKETRKGRYQLEGDNHFQLVENDGEYDFILRDHNDDVIDEKTMDAEEVDQLLIDNDRKWPVNSKLKLQWTDIHTELNQ